MNNYGTTSIRYYNQRTIRDNPRRPVARNAGMGHDQCRLVKPDVSC